MNEEQAEKVDGRRRPNRKIEILQGVMALLEEGDRKVTTAALAARVGLSEAALYRHFPGKAAIFLALVDYVEGNLIKPGNRLLDSGESPLEQLRTLLKFHLKFLAEHPGLCRVFLVEGVVIEAPEVAPRMTAVLRKYHAQVKQLLRRAQAAEELPEDLPVTEAAHVYVGLVQARALRFILSGFQERPDQEWKPLWRLLRRALRGT